MIVVSDTSAIANLIMVAQAHLLPALFGRVIVPDVVYQELLATGILGILLAAKQGGLIISVQPIMDGLIAQANFRVSPALYAEVLKLATE